MQLQFDRKPFRCLRYAPQDIKNFEETLELRLPENDGGTILCVKGQPLIRSKEWRGGRAGVTGGVAVSVLYIPEDTQELRGCEGWIPFQQSWDVPEGERDGVLHVSCTLRSLDGRMTGADKLMVTASVSLAAQTLCPESVPLAQSEDLPEDVHVLRRVYPLCVPSEAGEKNLLLDEEILVPPGKAAVERIVHASVLPGSMEQRLVGDKLVLRMTALLKLLYMGADGKLEQIESALPVSQYVQLDREYGEDASVQVTAAVTELETQKQETGSVGVKGGLVAQYVVFENRPVTMVEDAYSNCHTVQPIQEPFEVTQVLEHRVLTEELESMIPVQAESVVSCDVLTSNPMVFIRDGRLELREEGTLQLLYYDRDDRLQCALAPWQVQKDEETADDLSAVASAMTITVPKCSVAGEGINAHATVSLQLCLCTDVGIPAVVGLEMETQEKEEGRKPGVILCKAGDHTLWQIAKECGSDVEAIQRANALTAEPEPERMLLIPVG